MLRAAVLLSLAFFCSACNSASPTSPNSSRPSASPTFTTFDPLGSSTQGSLLFCSYGTYHQDINISGTIVGSFFDSNQTSHGFIRSSNGSFTIIDAPNSSAGCSQGTYLAAVNVSGTITGSAATGNSTIGQPAQSEAFTLTTSGQFNSIAANVLGPSGISPASINDSGTVVGRFFDQNLIAHGFIASANGDFKRLDAPGVALTKGLGTFPSRINASGDVVGFFTTRMLSNLLGTGQQSLVSVIPAP
jgi:hypothetical protein